MINLEGISAHVGQSGVTTQCIGEEGGVDRMHFAGT